MRILRKILILVSMPLAFQLGMSVFLFDQVKHTQSRIEQEMERKRLAFHLAPVVWRDMLSLIYSGNSRAAFRLLDEFWSKELCVGNLECSDEGALVRATKQRFERMFLEQLRHSRYLHELKELNRDDPRICILQCSKEGPSFEYQ